MSHSEYSAPRGSVLGLREAPNAAGAEAILLGSLLANNANVAACDGLRPQHFIDPANGLIFDHVQRQIAAGHRVDAVTLSAQMANAGLLADVGGKDYIARLLGQMMPPNAIPAYVGAILDAWMRREALDKIEVLASNLYAPSPGHDGAALIREAVGALDVLSNAAAPSRATSWGDAVRRMMLDVETAMRSGGGLRGLPSGFASIDQRLGGFEPGQVYVIAGRPGSGKSALAHQIALFTARAGRPVHEVALEMSSGQMAQRGISAISGVALTRIKNGWLHETEVGRMLAAQRELDAMPLTIDDQGGKTADEVAQSIIRQHRMRPLAMAVVDHLHLIRPDSNGQRHGGTFAVEQASGAMLAVAKRCGIPLILLAQLSRAVEGRDDHRPTLADLRQAGAIEQDAYAVGFVFRPEMYLTDAPAGPPKETDEQRANRLAQHEQKRADLAGVAEIVWGKIRDGEPGIDKLRFNGPTTSFSEGN